METRRHVPGCGEEALPSGIAGTAGASRALIGLPVMLPRSEWYIEISYQAISKAIRLGLLLRAERELQLTTLGSTRLRIHALPCTAS